MKPDVCTSRKRETLMVKKPNGLVVPMIRIKELAKGMALLEDQFKKAWGHYATLTNIGDTAKSS
jgi:hypothetical protein|tara:strand:+ start:1685 stop:1876 length:192 start_codon:yes stop_codon:yes gene_type:complete